MNLKQLRARLDELEAEAGTDMVSVGIIHERTMLGVQQIDHSVYRDPGEENHVFWLITGKY